MAPKRKDDDILDAQIIEQQLIKVGTFRTLFFLIPSGIVAFSLAHVQKQIFELSTTDLSMMIMFAVCGFVSVITIMYNYTLVINNKGKQIYNSRLGELVNKEGSKRRSKVDQSNQPSADENEEAFQARSAIYDSINYESTLFGLWFVNLIFIFSFLFISFVVIRFWPTQLNYYGSTLGSIFLTYYLTSTLNPPSE